MAYLLTFAAIVSTGVSSAEVGKSAQLINMGVELLDKGDAEKALVYFKRATLPNVAKHAPKEHIAAAWANTGAIYATSNKIIEAIQAYEQAVAIDSTDDDLFRRLGSLYMHKEELDTC